MGKKVSKFELFIDNNKKWFIEDIRDWKTQRKGKYLIKTHNLKPPTEVWLVKSVLHREDGPAIKAPSDDREFWFLNGDEYTKDKWIAETRKLKLQKLGV